MALAALRASWRRAAGGERPIYARLPQHPQRAADILAGYLPESIQPESIQSQAKAPTIPTAWDRSVLHELTRNGGFSFHDHPGDGPKSGYMVALPGAEDIHTLQDVRKRPDIVADYLDLHKDDLAQPNRHFGGWVHRGKVFFDVSEHTHDANAAKELAKQHGQLAYYDLGTGQSVFVSKEAFLAAGGWRDPQRFSERELRGLIEMD